MHPKNFLVKIYAYQFSTEFVINCMEGPLDIENAIIDKLGKNDIKWEYLGEMMNPKVNRITYEEVINCLLYTSPSPRDGLLSRMPSSA